MSAGGGDCYANSAYVTAPDMPITALGKLTLSGTVAAGGNDTVVFNNGTEAYSITGKDSSSIFRPSGRNRSSTSSVTPAARERISTKVHR
jgi:hypothetical protein